MVESCKKDGIQLLFPPFISLTWQFLDDPIFYNRDGARVNRWGGDKGTSGGSRG